MRIDRPECGLYKTRLWPTAPGQRVVWVPAIIYAEPARDPTTGQRMDRAPALICVVNGEERDPYSAYLKLHPCDAATYEQLCRAHESACERVVAAIMMEPHDADQ